MKSKWIFKAIIQKIISYLPFSFYINFLFQKYVTKGLVLTDQSFNDKLAHLQKHINFHNNFFQNQSIVNSLELGSGWHPIVPIGLYLYGVENIYSIDINSHISKSLLSETILKFIEFDKANKLNQFISYSNERINTLKEIYNNIDSYSELQILEKLNIHYQIQDATKLSFKDSFFQLVHSNNTFEHINISVLPLILSELNRVKATKGIMSHFIDMTDHYSHFDHSISNFNFLKFSSKAWSWIDNSIQPMNRLRMDDYLAMYNSSKLMVLNLLKFSSQPDRFSLNEMSAEFKSKDLDILKLTHVYIVS